jgi:hypothetical protein
LLLLLLLLLLRLALALRRRRRNVSALHSFLLDARFIHTFATARTRDLLLKSRRWTSARLSLLSSAQRRRRPEPYPLIVTLWRILSGLILPWTLLLTWSSRWLATLFLLPRRSTFET